MTQPQLLEELTRVLKKEGSENPVLEGQLLYSHLLKSDRQKNVTSKEFQTHLDKHLKQIKMKIPVQRQLGFTKINELTFKITDDVLLPGPEMEILLKACFDNIKRPRKIIDLCTGSGVIAISLGKKFKKAEILATDISSKALRIAKLNSQLTHVTNVKYLLGDLFQPISKLKVSSVDLMVSNPPYCKTEDIVKLPSQIKLYTPLIAVDGGEDGMFFHRIIISKSKEFLKRGGVLILENEVGQSKILKKMLIEGGFKVIRAYKNGKKEERVIVAKYL